MFLTTLQLFRYIQSNAVLPHLVRFNSYPLSASEIIPLRLHTVKGVFANFAKLQKITFINLFIRPGSGFSSATWTLLGRLTADLTALRIGKYSAFVDVEFMMDQTVTTLAATFTARRTRRASNTTMTASIAVSTCTITVISGQRFSDRSHTAISKLAILLHPPRQAV